MASSMKAKTNLHQQASEKTRATILQAARTLFIKAGFSGTSIGAIANVAQINQSLIYHHFESKEDLWRQVKAEIIASVVGTELLAGDPGVASVDELLDLLITRRFKLHLQHPDLVRLLMWQALEENTTAISGTSESWSTSWVAAIASLQKQGKLTTSLKPQEVLLLINGIIWAPFITTSEKEIAKTGPAFCRKMVKQLKVVLKP